MQTIGHFVAKCIEMSWSVDQLSIFGKDDCMQAIKSIRWITEDSWVATFANLLPLWLLSAAILSEGFPHPPIPRSLAVAALVLALAVGIVLLRKIWLTVDLLFVTLFPLILMFVFTEISTSYKTPFILLCTVLLSAGMIGAQRSNTITLRWVILLLIAVAAYGLAAHAAQNYWHMAGEYCGACFPDGQGYPPLTGRETPWWVLFFRP
jgi:hypothetical protein